MKTIFDLGLHEGFDTEFYLRKGFRVIAVEANPQLAAAAEAHFADATASGQLAILNKALAERSGMSIPFYVRTDKNEWSSIYRDLAERDGVASTPFDIETVTLDGLIAEFGVPYFIKCDIEGADHIVLAQIAAAPARPRFVSSEVYGDGNRIIDLLVEGGYTHFQFVNQGYHYLNQPPNPPREGAYVPMQFHGRMSGLFGEELTPDYWVGEKEVRRQLTRWERLTFGPIDPIRRFVLRKYGKWTGMTWLINRGWLDIHARLGEDVPHAG
jgi:FkbM family methyltransferase